MSFYFYIYDLACKIRKNKNLVKNSTYLFAEVDFNQKMLKNSYFFQSKSN